MLARMLLFLSSYSPLAIILAVLYYGRQPLIAGAGFAAALSGLFSMAAYLTLVRRFNPTPARMVDFRQRDEAAMGYIVTYLVPFLAVASSDWRQALALGIFFVMLGIIYVNSNMLHVNPILNLVGYHLYEVTLEDGGAYSLITRRRIHRGETLYLIQLGDNIVLEKHA
jgi:hypothetical protein